MKRIVQVSAISIVTISTFFMLAATSSDMVKTISANSFTDVSISNNAEGSENSVDIRNEVNTYSDTDSSLQTRTHIRIEQNGEVKEYNSDKPEDITIQSNDGKTKVRVNNKGSNFSINENENTESDAKDSDSKVSQDIQKDENELKEEAEAKKKEINEQKNIFQQFIDSIKDFFKNFKLL